MGESGNLTRVEERGIYHLNSHLPALKDTLRAIPAWLSDTNIRAGARMFETFPKARRHPAISFQAECPHVKTAARKLCQGHVAILGSKSHIHQTLHFRVLGRQHCFILDPLWGFCDDWLLHGWTVQATGGIPEAARVQLYKGGKVWSHHDRLITTSLFAAKFHLACEQWRSQENPVIRCYSAFHGFSAGKPNSRKPAVTSRRS